MSDEQYASYEVPGAQLRYAKAMLDANGIPIQAINRQGAMYVIIIPAAYAGFDHNSAPRPRRKRWWMPSRKTLVTLAMFAVVGFGVYMFLSGGITITGVSAPTLPVGPLPGTMSMPPDKFPPVPAVQLPALTNPLAGVNASLNETANGINRTADAARNAAVTFVLIVAGVLTLIGLWAIRGPLVSFARVFGDIPDMLKKAVKHG